MGTLPSPQAVPSPEAIPSPEAAAPEAAGDGTNGATLQLVTFNLGEDEYGIDIMTVREIRVWAETTTLPNTAEFVLGVINLRGLIVPIFDLRRRFGQGATTLTETHVIIIISMNEQTLGILVDSVSDIVTVKEDDIRPVPQTVPETGEADGKAFISGLVTVDKKMVALIVPARLFGH